MGLHCSYSKTTAAVGIWKKPTPNIRNESKQPDLKLGFAKWLSSGGGDDANAFRLHAVQATSSAPSLPPLPPHGMADQQARISHPVR